MPNTPITIGNPCIAISRPDKRLNKFLQGGVISSFSMPKEVRSIAPHAFANIGGLQEIIFTNQDDVVEVSDDAGIAPSVKFVVPEQLVAGYRERYPERTIVSYETGYEWTIPYVEGETSTTLTAAYINECLLANPDAKKASKVVVPSYFAVYEAGCFDFLIDNQNFTGLKLLGTIELSKRWNYYYTKTGSLSDNLDSLVIDGYLGRYFNGESGGFFWGVITKLSNIKIKNSSMLLGLNNLARGATFNMATLSIENCPNCRHLNIASGSLANVIVSDASNMSMPATDDTGVVSVGGNFRRLVMNGCVIGSSLCNLSYASTMSREDINALINSLGTPETTQTLTIGTTNVAKLTNADIQLAYDKNWALSPAPSAFTLEIGSDTYSCDFGMTWAEWVASAYNVDGYYVSMGSVYDSNDNIVRLNGVNVKASGMVRYGDSYTHNTTTVAYTYTIPFEGNTELTAAALEGIEVNTDTTAYLVTKLIVPSGFTSVAATDTLAGVLAASRLDTLEISPTALNYYDFAEYIPDNSIKKLILNTGSSLIRFLSTRGIEELYYNGSGDKNLGSEALLRNVFAKKIVFGEGIINVQNSNTWNIYYVGMVGGFRLVLPSTLTSLPNRLLTHYFFADGANAKVVIESTTTNISQANNRFTDIDKVYVPSSVLTTYLADANWSNGASKIIGFLDYTDSVPTFTGFDATWYSDEDCTISVLPENFVSGQRYFVKLSLPAEFAIPYNGNSTLTTAYVTALMSLPNASNVTKIIIPNSFTDYDIDAFSGVASQLTSLETLEFGINDPTHKFEDFYNNISKTLNVVLAGSSWSTTLRSTYKKVTFKNTISSIGAGNYNEALINSPAVADLVEIEEGVTGKFTMWIGDVKRIIIPSTITSFGKIANTQSDSKAFIYGNSLKSATDANFYGLATLMYVESSLLISYMTATNWSNYANKMVGYLDYTDTVPTFSEYTDQWYEDEDCTMPISTASFVSGTRYFVKLTALA